MYYVSVTIFFFIYIFLLEYRSTRNDLNFYSWTKIFFIRPSGNASATGFSLRITILRTRIGRNSAEQSVKPLIFKQGRPAYIICDSV